MPKRKTNKDPDYDDDAELQRQIQTKKSRKEKAVIAPPMSKEDTKDFLEKHHNMIISNHANGMSPSTIAAMLSAEVKRPGAINNRQISNWIYQRKKAGKTKTKAVSAKNKNLRADSSNQAKGCM
jgi:hypothetical protein